MDGSSPSAHLAERVIDKLAEAGVENILFCPGGRNAFLLQALLHHNKGRFRVQYHFEERSAGFYGVGLAKKLQQPVAVIVTSGTAAGELIPACMEAYFSGTPVIFVTADRPCRFAGSGAPQTANQAGLFANHVVASLDCDEQDEWDFLWAQPGPVHWNFRFEDPNAKAARPPQRADQTSKKSVSSLLRCFKNPLCIIGELRPEERASVEDWLSGQRLIALFEPLSGLRESEFPTVINVRNKNEALAMAQQTDHPFDGVIRIGGVPTLRLWRDLEDSRLELPVLSFSSLPFSGLGRPSVHVTGELHKTLPNLFTSWNRRFHSEFQKTDLHRWQKWQDHLDQFPLSEPALFRALSHSLPPNAHIFLGNSLPIREWDAAAAYQPNQRTFTGSRGLNGIDGQVSAFLGGIEPDRPNFAIIGDLGFLYDVAGFWPKLASSEGPNRGTVIVINNGGGRIFDAMFGHKTEFQNEHELSLEPVAKLFRLPYQKFAGCPLPAQIADEGGIIEIVPDWNQTRALAEAWTKVTV